MERSGTGRRPDGRCASTALSSFSASVVSERKSVRDQHGRGGASGGAASFRPRRSARRSSACALATAAGNGNLGSQVLVEKGQRARPRELGRGFVVAWCR